MGESGVSFLASELAFLNNRDKSAAARVYNNILTFNLLIFYFFI